MADDGAYPLDDDGDGDRPPGADLGDGADFRRTAPGGERGRPAAQHDALLWDAGRSSTNSPTGPQDPWRTYVAAPTTADVASTEPVPADLAPLDFAPNSGAPTSGAPTSGAPASGAPTSGAPMSVAPGSGAPAPGHPDTGRDRAFG